MAEEVDFSDPRFDYISEYVLKTFKIKAVFNIIKNRIKYCCFASFAKSRITEKCKKLMFSFCFFGGFEPLKRGYEQMRHFARGSF